MARIPSRHGRGRQWSRALVPFLAVAGALGSLAALEARAEAQGTPFPRYDHVFLIVEENHGFDQIIGNPAAPNLNRLANQFGLATASFSVADPSAPNYVAMLGGSAFGIADDNAYYLHTVDKPSLMSELDDAHMTWKAYMQSMP
jgi:hypothetical protein